MLFFLNLLLHANSQVEVSMSKETFNHFFFFPIYRRQLDVALNSLVLDIQVSVKATCVCSFTNGKQRMGLKGRRNF